MLAIITEKILRHKKRRLREPPLSLLYNHQALLTLHSTKCSSGAGVNQNTTEQDLKRGGRDRERHPRPIYLSLPACAEPTTKQAKPRLCPFTVSSNAKINDRCIPHLNHRKQHSLTLGQLPARTQTALVLMQVLLFGATEITPFTSPPFARALGVSQLL